MIMILRSLLATIGAALLAAAVQAQTPAPARFEGDPAAHAVDNGHIVPSMAEETLVINLPQRMIFQRGDGDRVTAYPVAIGRPDWRTPVGAFTVLTKETNPTWNVPASILEESLRAGRVQPPVVPPGPGNPLGKHWIGLSLPGIGIHGTTAPSSIFTAASHGCVRMRAADVADLFATVAIGEAGRIVYEPVLLAESRGRIYLEVHRDIYGKLDMPLVSVVRSQAGAAGLTDRIDWVRAAAVVQERAGLAREVTRLP